MFVPLGNCALIGFRQRRQLLESDGAVFNHLFENKEIQIIGHIYLTVPHIHKTPNFGINRAAIKCFKIT
jgi:hypothetical protein